jgi:hypothetical protein
MRIIRESGTLQQASASSLILGDKGYAGQLGIVTAQKKSRKRSRELLALEEDKVKRHELESERAAIENINQRVKQWHIISGVYRGEHHYTHRSCHSYCVCSDEPTAAEASSAQAEVGDRPFVFVSLVLIKLCHLKVTA